MKDLREESGTEDCIVDKIVKSRMKLAGQNERRDCRKDLRQRRKAAGEDEEDHSYDGTIARRVT